MLSSDGVIVLYGLQLVPYGTISVSFTGSKDDRSTSYCCGLAWVYGSVVDLMGFDTRVWDWVVVVVVGCWVHRICFECVRTMVEILSGATRLIGVAAMMLVFPCWRRGYEHGP